jgi:hypothetical protein
MTAQSGEVPPTQHDLSPELFEMGKVPRQGRRDLPILVAVFEAAAAYKSGPCGRLAKMIAVCTQNGDATSRS